MARSNNNNRILWTDSQLVMRVFGIFAACLAFAAAYLMFMSAVTDSIVSLCAVFVGIAVVVVYLALADKKLAKLFVWLAVVLYTLLCVVIGLNNFIVGAASFINNISATSNANMHWGFSYITGITASAVGDFLFGSVLSAWLGLGCAAIYYRRSIMYIVPIIAITVLWLCLGLVPKVYAVIMLVFGLVSILIFDRGLTIKAAACYLGVAAVIFGAVSPCLLYKGSDGVTAFKSTVSDAVQDALYGTDSLPQGKLALAPGMRSGRDVRLNVTLTGEARNLYLRGFIGSELNGNRWRATDKNAYVSDGYQGLLEYVAAENIPMMQYSRYLALCDRRASFSVTVENVGASRKYIYVPYTLGGFETGYVNYDMNILGNVFSPRTYTFDVFAGDKSCEVVSQATWLTNSSLQTADMSKYVALEAQYRIFAYDTYGARSIDDGVAEEIRGAMGVRNTEEKINPATNIIRHYFDTNFVYSDKADGVGDDFVSDFFGGKIKKANAAYFASAATLAFRMYGYAARYAEGYLMYADEGQTEVSVTGNYSHAWTEVYFDGIGWLPIEVTPGFYNEAVEIDPDDPDTPDDPPTDPIIPPEPDTPDDPPPPDKPPEIEPDPLTPSEQKLLTALKVLLPIASVLLAAALVVLAFVLNRTIRLRNKNKSLDCNGEAFGRAAYKIIERDCASIGGCAAENLESVGIMKNVTERFMQIVERCVYGGYDLSVNEREFVLRYIRSVADAVTAKGGSWHKFVCKYVRVLGI